MARAFVMQAHRGLAFVVIALLGGCGAANHPSADQPMGGTGSATGGAGAIGEQGSGGATQANGSGGTHTDSGGSPGTGGRSAPSGGAGGTEPLDAGGPDAAAAAGDGAIDGGHVVACDPADRTPEATAVAYTQQGSPPTGPYPIVIETEPSLDGFTIYRPMDLQQRATLPLIVFENGGCIRDGLLFAEFISEIVSYGFVAIISGPPNGSAMGTLGVDGANLLHAMDWATTESERPCSKYYRKLEADNVAAMGQSCGGLHAYGVSKDPRVTTVGIWNSGMLNQDQMVLDGLHSSIGYFIGGMNDVAYPNADADFKAIKQDIPVFYGNLDVGHLATYSEDNGGEFARVGTAWLRWQLQHDESPEAKGMFVGATCGLCMTNWVILKKNID